MVSLETVEREIDELEARETTYRVCERLAWLYVVRDHLRPTSKAESMTVPDSEGSEFMRAAGGKKVRDVMSVIDEHLETLHMMYPATYSAVIDKIRQLP